MTRVSAVAVVVAAAFVEGWRRVLGAPAVLLVVCALTWPIAWVAWSVPDRLGLVEGAVDAVLVGPVTGFRPSYTPTVMGTERLVRDIGDYVGGGSLPAGLAAATATTLLVWTFLLGGILDRYARQHAIGARALVQSSGEYVLRFLRLGVIAAAGYWLLFGVVYPRVFPPGYPFPQEEAAGVQAFMAPAYAALLVAAACWSAVIDYARIRTVVEDRRSMLGALLAGWRFVAGHPLKAGGLYVLNAAAFALVTWAAVSAFITGSSMQSWLGAWLALSLFVPCRVALKLAFFASQLSLCQRSLAKLAYTALPDPVWTDAPGEGPTRGTRAL